MIGDGSKPIDTISALASLQDGQNERGLGASVAGGLREISLEERIALAGEFAVRRFASEKNQITLVYRNPEFFVRSFVGDVLQDLDFPCKKEDMKEYFGLVSKAEGGDEEAFGKLQNYFEKNPSKDKIIQTLLPCYRDYIEAVPENFRKFLRNDINQKLKTENEGRKKSGLEERVLSTEEIERQVEERYNAEIDTQLTVTSPKSFLGVIGFSFVEGRALELDLQINQGKKLAEQCRSLRGKGILDNVSSELEKARLDNDFELPKVKQETIESVGEIYLKKDSEFKSKLKVYNSSVEKVEMLSKLCGDLIAKYEKDSPERNELRIQREKLLHAHDELKAAKLKGKDISLESIAVVDKNVKLQSTGLLAKAAEKGDKNTIEKLLKYGTDPTVTTTQYQDKRNFVVKLLFPKPPLTPIQIAEENKHHIIVESMNQITAEQGKLITKWEDSHWDDPMAVEALRQHTIGEYSDENVDFVKAVNGIENSLKINKNDFSKVDTAELKNLIGTYIKSGKDSRQVNLPDTLYNSFKKYIDDKGEITIKESDKEEVKNSLSKARDAIRDLINQDSKPRFQHENIEKQKRASELLFKAAQSGDANMVQQQLKQGASLLTKTTDYKRNFTTWLKDLGGPKKPRTAVEIAEMHHGKNKLVSKILQTAESVENNAIKFEDDSQVKYVDKGSIGKSEPELTSVPKEQSKEIPEMLTEKIETITHEFVEEQQIVEEPKTMVQDKSTTDGPPITNSYDKAKEAGPPSKKPPSKPLPPLPEKQKVEETSGTAAQTRKSKL